LLLLDCLPTSFVILITHQGVKNKSSNMYSFHSFQSLWSFTELCKIGGEEFKALGKEKKGGGN
jgi:Holliday junction resolvasome RuvABC DNA-binding subunit